MPDNEAILQHLLHIEAEAANMVNDAQTEAGRRAAEAEKAARAGHDAAYAKQAAALEAEYQRHLEEARKDYEERLAAYRAALDAAPLDQARFSALAEGFLCKDG
ncbi:MAG: hypothetical protein LBR16_03370 [Treponema sp.]|jgi:DNA-binding transcriptional MocR family regulator|nr:hypothetical protein [Treponema sp.]